MNEIAEGLKAEAAAAHAAYPQYDGYFTGWELGSLVRRIRTKGGTDLAAGSVVLANFDHEDVPEIDSAVSFYDPATTHVVLVDGRDIERVEITRMVRHADGLVWMVG